MLYELRTTARGRGGRELGRAVGDAVVGAFQTEVGDTGRTVVIRPHEALDVHGAPRVLGETRRQAQGADLFGKHDLELLAGAPFMRPWQACDLGKVWELSWYDYAAGAVADACAAFGVAMPHREEYYPIVGCWTEEVGPYRDRIYVLAPFKDWDHRDELTSKLRGDTAWPPRGPVEAVAAGSKLLLPTAYSKLH